MSKLKIVVISGLPGSGKSTVSEAVAKRLELPILSVDPIESSIIHSGIKRSFETGLAAYLIAQTLASEQLRLGISVVIDAVSSVQKARDMWHNLGNTYNAKVIVIECVLDSEIHKKRIEARVRNMTGMPEVTWEDVENRRSEYLEWKEKRLIVDTAANPEINLDKVLKYINVEK